MRSSAQPKPEAATPLQHPTSHPSHGASSSGSPAPLLSAPNPSNPLNPVQFPSAFPAPVSRTLRLLLPLALFLLPFSLSQGCGLDWTLPQAHFEGVDEQGYVAYWEKIGQADLGDGLVIPVHINFNSHRETSSPTLGKGWMLPLLESHVEPVDENTVHVIMPDGWTFVFYRNGNTDTWRGNAGWVGETDGPRFTATAPCGWRVKFDTGKIIEIDTPKNRTISIKYNGPAPLEADIDNQPFVQVAQNTATGVAESITIGGQKIAISQAPRPRIQVILGKTLLTGFDPALSQLQWPDGQREAFNFAAPETLSPTLVITKSNQTKRYITWDSSTKQIERDGDWTYKLTPGDNVFLNRTNPKGQTETYFYDQEKGISITQDLNESKVIVARYINAGSLNGRIRSITQDKNGVNTVLRKYDYDEKGRLIREIFFTNNPHELDFKYNAAGKESEVYLDGKKYITKVYDSQNRLVSKVLANGTRMSYEYLGKEIRKTTFLKSGKIMVKFLNERFQQMEELVSANQNITKLGEQNAKQQKE